MSAPRVFISYAHDSVEHEQSVAEFWVFLRRCGVDARLDVFAAQFPQDWPLWMEAELTQADFVLMIASPAYRRRSGAEAAPTDGRGAQWESRLLRDEFYRDQTAARNRILPVVLPGRSADELPTWVGPSQTHFTVTDFSPDGAEPLLRYLTGQTRPMPPIGDVVTFDQTPFASPAVGVVPSARPGATPLRSEVVVRLSATPAGTVLARTDVDETLSGEVTLPWPPLPLNVLAAVGRQTPAGADQTLRDAGQALARAVWTDSTRGQLLRLLDRRLIEQTVGVVVTGPADLLQALPVELAWLPGAREPICLEPGVTVCRRVDDAPRVGPATAPGPVKVLAAVAAPDGPQQLDVEAEMQAILDATREPAQREQLRILELAHPDLITEALRQDRFHVMHLSAHGATDLIVFETEDGGELPVDAAGLLRCLRAGGQAVPLIVLSACSGLTTDHPALAASLIAHGADRVITLQASVTDAYATELARLLYANLVHHPDWPIGRSLADARQTAELQRRQADPANRRPPEWPLATLWSAAGDGGLVDASAPPEPLRRPQAFPQGGHVRELRLGELIGRRAEVREAMNVFRRHEAARARHGAAGGVILTGLGGIGKTAVAGRLAQRLRDDGWLVAIHDGTWNPAALFSAVARAVANVEPRVAQALSDLDDDEVRLALVAHGLAQHRLLVLFDDFEQNLTLAPDGAVAFADDEAGRSLLGHIVSSLAETAARSDVGGGLLVTSRYPLPGDYGTFLVPIGLPPLSSAEMQRLFLRLPALRDLSAADRQLLHSTVGGHPRLIYFVDALCRGGKSNLADVTRQLRRLAADQGVTISASPVDLSEAVRQALALGSENILLDALLGVLDATERTVLNQAHVCRMALPETDLAQVLAAEVEDSPGSVGRAVSHLRDLTLLLPGTDVQVLPALAVMIDERLSADELTVLHHRALTLHKGHHEARRFTLDDATDMPYHLSAIGQTEAAADWIDMVCSQLDGALSKLAFLIDVCPAVPAGGRPGSIVAHLLADSYLTVGDTDSAAVVLSNAHRQIQRLADTDPANTDWQRDLSISHERLGDLARAAGDTATATRHYTTALDIAERLVGIDPANAQWAQDLARLRANLGRD
jgi:hypothetical protein